MNPPKCHKNKKKKDVYIYHNIPGIHYSIIVRGVTIDNQAKGWGSKNKNKKMKTEVHFFGFNLLIIIDGRVSRYKLLNAEDRLKVYKILTPELEVLLLPKILEAVQHVEVTGVSPTHGWETNFGFENKSGDGGHRNRKKEKKR